MSVEASNVEHMFEDLADADLVDAMTSSARDENAACARRLVAIGVLDARRARELADCNLWRTDPWEEVAAEVSAALNIGRGRASGLIGYARALRDKLPAVAAVFATGAIDFRMMMTIVARTATVDDEVMGRLDAALARHVPKWMRLSGPKLADRIDLWVAKFDPAGVRVPPKTDEQRYVEIEPTGAGMAGIWANIHAPDAAALDQRLDALAGSVCPADPRTQVQRRADAVGALAGGLDRLACGCGSADCPAATAGAPVGAIVIHVLAEQATVDGAGDAPGFLPGFGIVPAESVRALAKSARLKPLTVPTGAPEPGYRPSAALAEFVRWRDLTCRFPGCDAPAAVCDIDHTVPYPRGATHPSNAKLYCRSHHLLKTFYTGPTGWAERQLPDGTVIWTAPTGHTYSTEPAGALIFPALKQSTGELVIPPAIDAPDTDRALAMPTRKQTREQDRRDRIAQERRERAGLIAEEERQRQAWLAANYEPPPF